MSEEGFFSRWARRKSELRGGRPAGEPQAPAETPAPAAPPPPDSPAATAGGAAAAGTPPPPPAAEAPPPTLADVARLTPESDYSLFVRRGVDEDVRRAALKKLFSDPHYNVMDGLDIYIDDYSKPDPIPPAMLRQLAQSQLLGLFRDEETPAAPGAAPAAVSADDGAAAAVAQSPARAADAAPPEAPAAPAAPDAVAPAAAADPTETPPP